MQSRAAQIRDLILIPVPFCLIAVGFFIAHIEEGGILLLVCAVAGVWFVLRPRTPTPPVDAGMDEPGLPEQSPPVGTGGGGPV